jgi:hypothetical protein
VLTKLLGRAARVAAIVLSAVATTAYLTSPDCRFVMAAASGVCTCEVFQGGRLVSVELPSAWAGYCREIWIRSASGS